jgi:hypothetical protein
MFDGLFDILFGKLTRIGCRGSDGVTAPSASAALAAPSGIAEMRRTRMRR